MCAVAHLVAFFSGFLYLLLEATDDLELLRDGLDLLGADLLLVLGQRDAHAGEVVIDALEQAVDALV